MQYMQTIDFVKIGGSSIYSSNSYNSIKTPPVLMG
jgi:hypothetical protein